jgi:hypothetical protein
MTDKSYDREKWLTAEKAWEAHGGTLRRKGEDVWPIALRINHRYGYPEPDVIEIEGRDYTSGRVIFELRLTPEQFGRALVGNMEGIGGFIQLADVGSRHEHEVIEVIVPEKLRDKLYVFGSGGRKLTKEALALLAEYEGDGWAISHSDFGNHHRSTRRGYMVTRHRFLPVSHAEARADVFKENA